jgi:tetratricopeptide (TPR) repeat protein
MLFIFLYLNIYIHEIGHAIAGSIAGFEMKRMVIGTGREILRTRIGKVLFVLTNNISGGVTHWGQVPKKYLKPKFAFLITGGILAQLFVTAIFWITFQVSPANLFLLDDLTLPGVFISSNLLLIFANLIPMKTNFMGIKLPTDGLQLLKLPFWTKKDIQSILSAGKIMDAYELYEAKKYPEAEELFRECVSNYPEMVLPRINVGASLIKQGKIDECIDFLEKSLQTSEKDPLRFFIYNNLGWAYLVSYTSEGLQKADDYSSKAYLLNNKHPNVLGTRACVLIEKGNIEDGLLLLRKAVKIREPIDDKMNDPVGFIYMAYGFYLQEKYVKARYCLDKVRKYQHKLDPDYQLVYDRILTRTENFSKLVQSSTQLIRI